MENEIAVFYVSSEDVEGMHIMPGWYFEHKYTEVPEGPFKSSAQAEQAGIADFNASQKLHNPIKVVRRGIS